MRHVDEPSKLFVAAISKCGGNVTILEVIDAYQLAETLRITRLDQEFAAHQSAAQVALVFGIVR